MPISPEINDSILYQARQDLHKSIVNRISEKNIFTRFWEIVEGILFRNYKLVLTGAIAVIIGIGIGFLIFSNNLQNSDSVELSSVFANKNILPGEEIKFNNLHFIDSDASDGDVSFTFDAVKPVKVKGKLSDPLVQKVLAYSLVSEDNAGVKIRTVNAISEQAGQKIKPDNQVKSALITALKFDSNPGVRRQALLALQKFPFDKEIKEAFLFTLTNDKNAGLRIAAINSINPDNLDKITIDKNLLEILKQKINNDENEYIRLRAKAVYEEVKNNENSL